MIIRAQKTELQRAIRTVMSAIPGKTTMDILTCILIDATVDQIKFTATDTELGIETVVSGEIDERGLICIDAKLFSDIVSKLPSSEVTITTDSNLQIRITCENTELRIVGKDGTEFASLPSIDRENPVVMSQFALREMIEQTIFSIAVNDANKLMTGALLETNENEIRMVCLDGHRIAIRRMKLDEVVPTFKVIIPGKTLSDLQKIMSGEEEDKVHIYFTKNEVLFDLEGTIVVSRLIEGTYFRIDQMLSNDFDTKITVRKADLSASVGRAMLFTSESEKRPLVVSITDRDMNLKINSPARGSMSDDIQITKEGKDLMIGFNPKFVADALNVIRDDEITIYFLNSKSPCFIRDEQQSYVYLILPVNFVA